MEERVSEEFEVTPIREELGLQPGDHVYTDHGWHGIVIDLAYRAGRWWVNFTADEDEDETLNYCAELREVHRVGPMTV